MIKLEIDVNVKGLEFLEGLLKGVKVDSPKNWTTNDVPKSAPQVVTHQPAQQPVPQQAMAPVSQVAYTLSQLQNAAATLIQSGKAQPADLVPILNGLGANALTDLAEDKFNEFAAELKKLGGVI